MKLYICEYRHRKYTYRSVWQVLLNSPIDPNKRVKPVRDPKDNIDRLVRFTEIDTDSFEWQNIERKDNVTMEEQKFECTKNERLFLDRIKQYWKYDRTQKILYVLSPTLDDSIFHAEDFGGVNLAELVEDNGIFTLTI